MRNQIMDFIENTGKTNEFKLFLKWIKDTPPLKFALIKISGECLENNLDDIVTDVVYLNKFGLYPIIVHGAGKTLDNKIPNSKKKNGIRITTKKDMKIISSVYDEINKNLVMSIAKGGGRAHAVENIFTCSQTEEYGEVGVIKNINIKLLQEMVENNITPIISPKGRDEKTNNELNINADDVAKAVIEEIHPKKLIMLTATGGILNESGDIMKVINVGTKDEYKHVTDGMLHKLKEMIKFLDKNKSTSVVITSPKNLLKEIFTIKGSGTFIKFHEIESRQRITSEMVKKIQKTLEDSFQKNLKNNFLVKIKDAEYSILYEKNYEGLAIMKKMNQSIYYLDKFAVHPIRQGTGLGKSIWAELSAKYNKIMWRAKPNNPFNYFYMKECDGLVKNKDWWVFWKGMQIDESLEYIDEIISLPSSFKSK